MRMLDIFEQNRKQNEEYRKFAQRYYEGENTCESCRGKVKVLVSMADFPNSDDEWLGCPHCGHHAYIRTRGIAKAEKA
ncbi:hypothetical protein [Streptococcus sp. sy004]|uniref:hypothetical protein n=1 Tax=Streptococcus sp. sy004 TaxID=2600149 RepID=UPI0011B694F0|nr:hypothetical protein [Streptococcus sp. sy004]TWT09915.1 hypothetical protein FRX54_05715 [Streptococcus sp. sy004]